jgi:hypothetical protein
MSESRPNPASDTDRAEMAAMARTAMPTTFQPSVAYLRANPPAQQGLASGVVHHGHRTSLPAPGILMLTRRRGKNGGMVDEHQLHPALGDLRGAKRPTCQGAAPSLPAPQGGLTPAVRPQAHWGSSQASRQES